MRGGVSLWWPARHGLSWDWSLLSVREQFCSGQSGRCVHSPGGCNHRLQKLEDKKPKTQSHSCSLLVKIVPADVGHRKAQGCWKALHPPRDQAEALDTSVLIAALKQQLEAQAYSKEGATCLMPEADQPPESSVCSRSSMMPA